MTPDSPTANLVGFLLGMVAFGAYVVLFVEHSKLMYKRRVSTWAFKYQAATSTSMAILIVMHMAADFKRTLDAFTNPLSYQVDASGQILGTSPVEFFSQLNTFQTRFRTGLYSGITLLADMFMVYRVFVVWAHNWYIASLPFVMFLASIGIATWHNLALTRYVSGVSFEHAQITQAILYFYSATLALNTLCTGLILGRIWWVRRRSEVHGATRLKGGSAGLHALIRALLESAVLYCLLLMIMIITNVTGSMVMFTMLNLISPVIGIIFSSIIVRTSAPESPPERYSRTDSQYVRNKRPRTMEGVQIHLETISRSDYLSENTPGVNTYNAAVSAEEDGKSGVVDVKDRNIPFAF